MRTRVALLVAAAVALVVGGFAVGQAATTYKPPCTTTTNTCLDKRVDVLEQYVADHQTPVTPPTTTPPVSTPPVTTPPVTTPPVTTPPVTTPPATGTFPNASTTGVTGTLTPSGSVTASTAGQVVQNLSITDGQISVTAQNVTIRNVKITTTSTDGWAIIVRQGASATIDHVTVAGKDKSTGDVQYAILSQTDSPVTVTSSDLSMCADCIQGEHLTVVGNYIHDMAHPPGAHVDGVMCNGECGVTVRGNTILNEYGGTSCVALYADFGTPVNSLVTGNLMAGGGYLIYGGVASSTGIQITNNVFSKRYFPNGGQYGDVASFNRNGAGNVWSGNTWEDGTPD